MTHHHKFVLKEFKQFLLRGNVVDLAVGVVMGAAFGTIVNSIVSDILTPFISGVASMPDFGGLYFTVNETKIMYGKFLNAFISFLLVGSSVFFFIVKPMNALVSRSKKEPPADPATKKCKECLSEIPIEAKRCAHCTQVIT